MQKTFTGIFFIAIIAVVLPGCKSIGNVLNGNKSPREKYEAKIEKLAPQKSAAWLAAGSFARANPLNIPTPYSERGFVKNSVISATAFQLSAKAGQQIVVQLAEASGQNFTAYLELYAKDAQGNIALVEAADTTLNKLSYNVKTAGNFIVSMQPEIAAGGNYNLQIGVGPQLVFPVEATAKSNIGSLWGDPRDGGVRKHEGIDIFAARGTNLVAVATGTIVAVDETEIGGKIISLRPDGADYTAYYAHLDEQMVTYRQRVTAGQVIGKVGNTGNAKTTVPHLHFGIYTYGGAVDPLLYVKKTLLFAPLPSAKTLSKSFTTTAKTKMYPAPEKRNAYNTTPGMQFTTEAFNGSFYRVVLANGGKAFVAAESLST